MEEELLVLPENLPMAELLGEEVLLVTISDQLNILGQTFRPIFAGKVADVTDGYVTLDPVIIKMVNAPFFRFPTPLNFPIERISSMVPFESDRRFPLI